MAVVALSLIVLAVDIFVLVFLGYCNYRGWIGSSKNML